MSEFLDFPVELTPAFQRHLFDLDDYERVFKLGILSEGARLELIEGEIVEMSSIGDARFVLVCRDPGPEGYRAVTEHGADATLAPLAAPDVAIALRPLIG